MHQWWWLKCRVLSSGALRSDGPSTCHPSPGVFLLPIMFVASRGSCGAGRSVVALGTGVYDREPYALKFFAERATFDAEVALQHGSAVTAMLPKMRTVHDPDVGAAAKGGATDGYGEPLPPCIVYGRGESLTLWQKRAKTDVFQAVAVRSRSTLFSYLTGSVSERASVWQI